MMRRDVPNCSELLRQPPKDALKVGDAVVLLLALDLEQRLPRQHRLLERFQTVVSRCNHLLQLCDARVVRRQCRREARARSAVSAQRSVDVAFVCVRKKAMLEALDAPVDQIGFVDQPGRRRNEAGGQRSR
jgi:hypothetical protein